MRIFIPALCLALAGCVETTQTSGNSVSSPPPSVGGSVSMQDFRAVQARVEPVAERECRERTRNMNCDFLIVVDTRANQPSNAYQSLDKSGRPMITFTAALIEDTRNRDEIAFIMGHEAAHHIENHISKQVETATIGAVLGTLIGSATGNQAAADLGQQIGGTVGARAFSKDMELEADALGTVISHKAGYDPRKGAEFFFRIPDPGDKFLGTHPPNNQRRETVNRVAAGL